MTPLDHALSLYRRGFSVIPVPRPGGRHDGKVPVIPWKRYQTARPTEAEIRDWFSGPPQNLAIITGAVSGIVAVDADSREGLRWCITHLPYTPWQTSTARGFHLFFRWPGVPIGNRAKIETRNGKIAVDVRGDGGYVIAPASIHASGVAYLAAGDWSRTDVPRFWPGWLQRPERIRNEVSMSGNLPSHVTGTARPTPPYSASWRPSGDVVTRARRYLATIPRPEIGHGSDAAVLYAACRLVRGFGLRDADAEGLLGAWAGGRPGWTREWIARKVQHARRYGTETVGGLLS